MIEVAEADSAMEEEEENVTPLPLNANCASVGDNSTLGERRKPALTPVVKD